MDSPLRDNAVWLASLDPSSDRRDLAPLGRAIGDARIVCVGESTHCNREFYLLKDRLFRYLVEEHGFTAFALESGFVEGWRLDEWILGGAGDLDELSRDAITYGLGGCAEMRALLQWMRDWNLGHDHKLRFYGMDLGGSTTNPGTSVAACLDRLPASAEGERMRELAELGPQHEALVHWLEMKSAQRAELLAIARFLVSRAGRSGDELANLSARSALVICEMWDSMVDGGQPPGGSPATNPRDAYMVDVLGWILARERRVLVAAHNAHIQRTPLLGRPMLGSLLAESGLPRAVTIGASSASGSILAFGTDGPRVTSAIEASFSAPDDSVDAQLAAIGLPLSWVDLRRLPPDVLGEVTTMLVQGNPLPIAPREAFDILVHVGQLTLCPELVDRVRDDLARANRMVEAAGSRPAA